MICTLFQGLENRSYTGTD